MVEEIYIPFTGIRADRFLVLLIAIISLFALRPFLQGIIGITLVMDIFFTIILLSGAYAVSQRKKTFIVATILLLPALVAHWITYFFNFVVGSPRRVS